MKIQEKKNTSKSQFGQESDGNVQETGKTMPPPIFQLKASKASEERAAAITGMESQIPQQQIPKIPQVDQGNGDLTPHFKAQTMYVINVRRGPGTQFDPPLRQLPKGTTIPIFESKDDWFRIGSGQWITGSSKYVKRMGLDSIDTAVVSQKSPDQQINEAFQSFTSGKSLMLDLAQALIPFCRSHVSQILAVFDRLPSSQRDNLAFSMAYSLDDTSLAGFSRSLLERMQLELGEWQNTTSWKANRSQSERIDRLIDSEFAALWRKNRLTTEEIATVRTHIDAMPDGPRRQQFYTELQEKVKYLNQRNVSAYAGETRDRGGSCNLTSLAMCLSYLGLSIPKKYQQMKGFPTGGFVEQLEFVGETERSNFNREDEGSGWGDVAKHVGAARVKLLVDGVRDRKWWVSDVKEAHLKKGHSVMCSIHGHIIRIQGIEESGIIVDDPFGVSKLSRKKGGKSPYHFDKRNDSDRFSIHDHSDENGGNLGENHIWSWGEVEKYNFHWVTAFYKA